MTLVGTFSLLLVMLSAVGAAVLEMWLATRNHPRRWLYGWLAWSLVAAMGVALMEASSGAQAVDAVVSGLLIGPFPYPILRLAFWLRSERPWGAQRVEEAYARDLARLRYHATDFEGVRPAKGAAAPTPPPIEPASAEPPLSARGERLARTVSPRHSPLAKGVELAVVVAVFVVAFALYLAVEFPGVVSWVDDSGAVEAVVETVEGSGYPFPRVRRDHMATHCHLDYRPFRWTAMGAQGRACANPETGDIEVKVDRVWPRDTALVSSQSEP